MTDTYTEENQEPDVKWLENPTTKEGTFSGPVVGTAATITDTTSYPVTDQDGLTSIVTILGDEDNIGAQTVTFGTVTTALQVAAAYNDQCKGLSAVVVGTDVKLTTDKTGLGVSISVAAGTGAITWGSPVAGTGFPGGLAVTAGMLLARTTSASSPYSAGDIVVYNSSNSPTGSSTIVGVASADFTLIATGSRSIDYAIAGRIAEDAISINGGTAVTAANLDSLRTNTGILPITVTDQSVYR